MPYGSVLDLIGRTPLVKTSLSPKEGVVIYAKLEYFNPTGSLKDRIALKMIEDAERRGLLTKDKIIVEGSSGNTGISLAAIGRLKGYRVLIFVPKKAAKEKIGLLKALGAEVRFADSEAHAVELARELASKDPRYVMLDQFRNRSNVMAHYEGTAREIWEDLRGQVDYVVAGIGTGGTIIGLAKFLKERKPDVKVIGVVGRGEEIDGLMDLEEYERPLFDRELVDEVMYVSRGEALKMVLRLVREEGILAGLSSGATCHAAVKIAERVERGNIVAICGDTALRYVSIIGDYFSRCSGPGARA